MINNIKLGYYDIIKSNFRALTVPLGEASDKDESSRDDCSHNYIIGR